MQETQIKKEAIIAEYLTGEYSYRQLGIKHGINFRKIHYWVSNYKGKIKPLKKQVKALKSSHTLSQWTKAITAKAS